MNVPVLLFSVALAFTTAIVFGLLPALQLSRPEIARLMQSSTRRVAGSVLAKRAHGTLVATQVALTLLLLTAAGAAGKGFVRLLHADLGYDPHNTMSVPIPVHENTHVTWKERAEYFEQIRARIAAMPQVVAAGISTNATPPSSGWPQPIEILGSTAAEKPEVRVNFVSPEYFPLRLRRAACGITRKPCAARCSPSLIKRWPASIGQMATPLTIRSEFLR